MAIAGLTKTTLLDYPGKVSATIFMDSCNFRCPFCHNSGLVLSPQADPSVSATEILKFLRKRQGILEGVCISGGEPTLSNELFSLAEQIHTLGYPIKLDTNGSRPRILKELVKNGLIDMIAMDIKTSPDNYASVCGLNALDINPILETADFLKGGSLPYEFRTTVVRELHTKKDFSDIGMWLAGCKAYYLQAYQDSPSVIAPGCSSYSLAELNEFKQLLKKTIPLVQIRGIG